MDIPARGGQRSAGHLQGKVKMCRTLLKFVRAAGVLLFSLSTVLAAGTFDNRLDYFGNGYSDWAVITNPAIGNITWSVMRNDNPTPPGPGQAVISIYSFGLAPNDRIPAFGDYTGDDTADIVVWRPGSQAQFWVLPFDSTGGVYAYDWGIGGDFTTAGGDYDGDGKMDLTVIRNEGGARWYILNSATNTMTTFVFGRTGFSAGGVLPGADYTGDGVDDPACFLLGTGREITWHVGNTSGQQINQIQWGDFDTDYIVPAGDYDGDGKADYAIWRGFGDAPAAEGDWWIYTSSQGIRVIRWGIAATASTRDSALRSGDYDNDGKTDIAVWRRTNQTFYVLRSSDGAMMQQHWGTLGDIPVASYGVF